MRRWIILAFAIFTIACLIQTAVTETPVIEEAIEEPFIEPTATPDCQHASGVTLEVRRIRDTTVELHVSGLQPGEKPSIIYSTSISGESSAMGEMYDFAEGADQHGEFSVDLPGLRPLEGQTSATWDIRFIHSRGVEWATITLP